MELLGYLVTSLAITGVVLNIKKNPICFFLWGISNGTLAVINLTSHSYYEVILFTVQFLMSLWGIYEWMFKSNKLTKQEV